MFGLFKRDKEKAQKQLDTRFVFPEDLVYAYYKKGDPWKDHSVKASMKKRFPRMNFTKSYKKCIKYGLVKESEKGTFAITDLTKELLDRHAYILFCAKHFPYARLNFYEMCAKLNSEEDASLYDIILAGLDKEDFIDHYVEWYMDDPDDDWDAEDIADRKKDAKSDAQEDYKEIMAKLKALKKEGLL